MKNKVKNLIDKLKNNPFNWEFIFKLKADKKTVLAILAILPTNLLCEVSRSYWKRSLPQNSYYWWVIIEIIRNELWYTADEMHTTLKYQFLKDRSAKYPKFRDTKNLNTKEFEAYNNNIKQWASIELWIYIPEPNTD